MRTFRRRRGGPHGRLPRWMLGHIYLVSENPQLVKCRELIEPSHSADIKFVAEDYLRLKALYVGPPWSPLHSAEQIHVTETDANS